MPVAHARQGFLTPAGMNSAGVSKANIWKEAESIHFHWFWQMTFA